MNIKTSLYAQQAMLAIDVVISAFYYQKLPATVPTHWNIEGKIDQYGSKLTAVLTGPILILMGIGLTLLLPKISPKRYEISNFEQTFAYAMVLVSGLFMFLSYVILRASAGGKSDIGETIMFGLFLFFAFTGNILGKVRRNFFMGIRTPWTLASEPVWDATHRLAGKIFFYGGIAGAILALLGLPMWGSLTLILVLSLWPVIQSYFIYQKIGDKSGE